MGDAAINDQCLQDALLAEYECPVCTEYMAPPIHQCCVGHSFCVSCFDKLKSCPTCRSPKGVARAYALEKIHAKLTFPCKFKMDGCTHREKGAKIKEHESYCHYGKIMCPLEDAMLCPWFGQTTNVAKHCKENHPAYFYQSSSISMSCPRFATLTRGTAFFFVIIQAYDELFKLCWSICPDTGLMFWCMYYLGAPKDTKRFVYEVTVGDEREQRESITFKACARAYVQKDKTFNPSHCMLTHFNMVKQFCDDNGDLPYFVKIVDTECDEWP